MILFRQPPSAVEEIECCELLAKRDVRHLIKENVDLGTASRNMLPIEGRDLLDGLKVREICAAMMTAWESERFNVEF